MSAYVLGVSAFYHDSAAALVRGGEIIAAAQADVKLIRCYTRAPGAGEAEGHFGAQVLTLCEGHEFAETFACGPPALLEPARGARAERFRCPSPLGDQLRL